MDRTIGTNRAHREAAAEAGLGRVSILSLLAGLVTAYGTFALVAAIAGSLLAAGDVTTDFRTNDWTGSGSVALLTSAVVLFVAYLFGGYVTGRMARRAGTLHGVLLFVATLVVGAMVGGVVSALSDDAGIRSNLRSIGVPTTMDQVTDVAAAGVIASLAAILLGSVVGSHLGERWHTKLARRIDDPEIGTSAAARRRVAEETEARLGRIHQDPTMPSDGRTVDLVDEERTAAPRRDMNEPRYTEAEWRARDSHQVR